MSPLRCPFCGYTPDRHHEHPTGRRWCDETPRRSGVVVAIYRDTDLGARRRLPECRAIVPDELTALLLTQATGSWCWEFQRAVTPW
jgi:hypothetical protein